MEREHRAFSVEERKGKRGWERRLAGEALMKGSDQRSSPPGPTLNQTSGFTLQRYHLTLSRAATTMVGRHMGITRGNTVAHAG